MKRNLILSLFAAAALMGAATVAQAEPAIVATMPPPAIVYESAPAPRDGFTWAPGHYEYRNGNYVWLSGQWMRERPGYDWQEAHWVRRPDGSWVMVGGRWVADQYAYRGRDRDDDGIINRFDSDRDGDGVPNRYDSHPNNRWRD